MEDQIWVHHYKLKIKQSLQQQKKKIKQFLQPQIEDKNNGHGSEGACSHQDQTERGSFQEQQKLCSAHRFLVQVEGIVHQEVIPPGGPVNFDFY